MGKRALKGSAALITGAAKRIGRATALALAREGVNIVVHYRASRNEALSLCEELSNVGVRSWAVQGDLGSGTEADLFDKALEVSGGISILVNNASTFPPSTLRDLTFDDVLTAFRMNAWAPFVLARRFAERVKNGSIVNLLDTRISGYDWNHVGYILSKHILADMTRMMARDFAPDISVNAVAPGLILPPPGETLEYLKRLKDTVPLKRHGDADDVAEAIVFLASSTFITGEVIYIDGGRHLRENEGASRG